ncbi:MAG: hypothetical protein ACRCWF_07050 [Beijerinckiaceae bacterium]
MRNQTTVLETVLKKAMVTMNPPRLNALLIHAIEEVSALTPRYAQIAVRLTKTEIVICGKNPLDLPDSELTLDRMLRLRAWPLQITPSLKWERGIGPVLTLLLPIPKVVVSMKKAVDVKIRQSHAHNGQRHTLSSRS